MTSPSLGGGSAIFLISSSATKLEFGELKVVSKIRKVKQMERISLILLA